jgi:Mannosyltransferase (PIG-V)
VLRHGKGDGRIAGIRFVLAVYATSRLFYLISGFLLAKVVPTSSHQLTTTDMPPGTLNIWSHWDGEHYVALARDGYLEPPRYISPAFFPVYPLLLRASSSLFGEHLSKGAVSQWGTLLSLLFLPLAFYFIYDIALQGWGERVAKGTILALAFFPTTFFLNATYTESLFLALAAGSLWAMIVRKNLLLACVLAGVAAATRNVGIFLVVPLMYEWIKGGGLRGGRERWRGLYLALAPSGLIIYMGYLWIKFDDPLFFYFAQKNWDREAEGPLVTATRAWDTAAEGLHILRDPGLWATPSMPALADHVERASSLYNLAFLVFALVVLLAGLRKLPISLTIYGLLLVIVPALFGTPDSPLMGVPRYVLMAFPIFFVLGLLSKNKLLLVVWLIVSTVSSIILCALFVSWRFVA